jgi:protocatechuate 3,4-dioxygenase beta subunit
MKLSRRQFFALLAGLPLVGFLSAAIRKNRPEQLAPTPACEDPDEPTPAQTEGPYFSPQSPERSSLREAGLAGTLLVLSGQVLNTRCQPVGRALLDWWHCDGEGQYDNEGFRCRGHQYTDAKGNFRLETIVPGLYPGRTRHLHVKVQGPGKPILTTQLYFPAEGQNQRDRIYDPALLMAVTQEQGKMEAGFTFVLKA